MVSLHSSWLASLPRESKVAMEVTPAQVVVSHHLLSPFGYPDSDTLVQDFGNSFQLVGDIPAGVGWPAKARPSSLSVVEFMDLNDEYIRDQLASREPDRHSELLLSEILKDVQSG